MMALTRDELLIVLIEECGEVIQSATKCLRFGWDRDQPKYGVNHEVLAAELGDMLGVSDALGLNQDCVEQYRRAKFGKIERNKRLYGRK